MKKKSKKIRKKGKKSLEKNCRKKLEKKIVEKLQKTQGKCHNWDKKLRKIHRAKIGKYKEIDLEIKEKRAKKRMK